jgi:WD40 repeat protein
VPEPPAAAAKPEQPKDGRKVSVDRYGDPLPQGAVARLGTKRFRHEGEANSLVFSPNGQMLAARTAGGVILWDARTGKELRHLSGVTGALALGRLIDFSPDGRTLVGPQGDNGVGFWDVGTGKQVRTPELPDKYNNPLDPRGGSDVHSVRFSPDGKFLVVLGGGNRFHVLDAAKGTALHHFKELVGGFAFAPDGKTLALGAFVRASKTFDIQIRDLRTGETLRRWEGHSELMCDMAFSPDGKTLAAGGTNRITLWDAATGKVRIRIEKKKMGQIVNLAFTPDGKTLVAGSEMDGKVHVWDVATGEERRQLDPRLSVLRSMALSPDGKTVAAGTVYNTIRLWDLATGRELFPDEAGHDSSINAVAYSPDGKLLVSAGENRQVWLWDTATGKPVRSIRLASARSVAFSPDGRRLALLTPGQYFSGKNILVCDATTGKELFRLSSDDGRQINALAYSPDGKTLVSADWKAKSATDVFCNLNLWDASTGRLVRRFSLTGIRPESIAFRDDGRTLAVGGASDRELIRLWELERGEEILALHRHDRDFVSSVAFSPDGRTLVSGGADRTVRLWEVATGKAIRVLKGHPKAVATVAFSPDGRTVASGNDVRVYPLRGPGSDAIRLWDAAGGEEIQHFEGHNSNVPSLAFSPDGTRLASGLRDSTVLLWEVPPYRHAPTWLRSKDLQSLWSDLAGEDAGKAYMAIRALADDPQETIPFLEGRLRPTPATTPEQIRRWIADLDSDEFAVRQAAQKELQRVGEEAIPLLRERLAAKPSLEVRKHIDDLLAQTKVLHEGEILRGVRAAAVLERIGSPEARRLLERLARGAPAARLTREAKSSLERLARRAAK